MYNQRLFFEYISELNINPAATLYLCPPVWATPKKKKKKKKKIVIWKYSSSILAAHSACSRDRKEGEDREQKDGWRQKEIGIDRGSASLPTTAKVKVEVCAEKCPTE